MTFKQRFAHLHGAAAAVHTTTTTTAAAAAAVARAEPGMRVWSQKKEEARGGCDGSAG